MEIPGLQWHPQFKGGALLCFFMVWAAVSGQIRYSIPEELEKDSFVGNIATDLGLGVKVLSDRSVRIVSRGKTQHFAFNLRNGHLYVNEQIDREQICPQTSPCLLHFEVIAQNPVALYRVEVEIQDINDNAPRFFKDETVLEISEASAPGTRILIPKATDPDVDINSVKHYHLNHNMYFKIDIISGAGDGKEPALVLENALDREDVAVHHLILTATDGGDPVRSGTMQIRVVVLDTNDNAPVFSQSVYTVSVMENVSEGTLLTTVTATDADAGSNSEITYSLGNDLPRDTLQFRVDSRTGGIFLAGPLDYEDTEVYELNIQAKDNGGLVAQSKLLLEVIDINDNPPMITITTLSSPVSEECAPGTVIAVFNVQDKDSRENGQITCSIPDNLPFELKGSFDNYYSLVTYLPLDREEASQYNILITAEDHGTPVLSTTQIIMLQISDVNNNPPLFGHPSYRAYVMENNVKAASVFSVKATDIDDDQNARISYSLINIFKQDDPLSSYVSINSDTGIIYALRSFDYEQLKELNIHVKAQDGGSPSLSSNTTVTLYILDQNDNVPQILYPSPNTDESTGVELAPRSSDPGYLVTKVVAVDADSGQNAWLCYHMSRVTDPGLFTVGLHNGEIRIGRLFLEKDSFKQTLIVLVKDNGQPPLSASVTLTVLLADSISEILSDLSIIEPPTDADSYLTLYLLIVIAFVSCLFLIFVIVILATRLLKWKETSSLESAQVHCSGLPASQFAGIDGVRAFLQTYCHEVTLTRNSGNENAMHHNASNTNSLINNLSQKDRDLIGLYDGNVGKEDFTSEVSS